MNDRATQFGTGQEFDRAPTRLGTDGAYYPDGATLPGATAPESSLTNIGSVTGGTLADVGEQARVLLERTPLSAAIEVLSPSERTTLGSKSLATSSLNSTTWTGVLGGSTPDQIRTWAQVLAVQNSPAVRATPLSAISLEKSPINLVEIGTLVLRNARLGDLPLGPATTRSDAFATWCAYIDCSGLGPDSTVRDVHLRGVPMRKVPLDRVPMRKVDPSQMSELMSIPMRKVDPALATGLASIPMRKVDLVASRVGTIPMRKVDLAISTIGAIPMRKVDLTNSPLGSILIGSLAEPSLVVVCSPSCDGSTLAEVSAAGHLHPDATVGALSSVFAANSSLTLGALFRWIGAETGGVDPTIGDLIRGLADDAEGNSFTIGDLVPGLPADDLPGDRAWDERATLGDLLQGILGAPGSVGFDPSVRLDDLTAVRLDTTASFTALRDENVRLSVDLPDGGRTELERPSAVGVFADGGPAGCFPAGIRLSDASAAGQFSAPLRAGCQYSLHARVAIPVRHTSPVLRLRIDREGQSDGWSVDGPTLAIGHGPDRDPKNPACVVTTSRPAFELVDCYRNSQLSPYWGFAYGPFVDPPRFVVGAGYVDAAGDVDIVEVALDSTVYVRSLGGALTAASTGIADALLGASPLGISGQPNARLTDKLDQLSMVAPAWLGGRAAEFGIPQRIDTIRPDGGWARIGGDLGTSTIAVTGDAPGWYQFAVILEDSFPNESASLVAGRPSSPAYQAQLANCASFVAPPVEDDPLADQAPGTVGLVVPYAAMWARYGAARAQALWAEVQAFRSAGLGTVLTVGSCDPRSGSFGDPEAQVAELLDHQFGTTPLNYVVLGGYDMIGALGQTVQIPGGSAPREPVEVGDEADYGPYWVSDRAATGVQSAANWTNVGGTDGKATGDTFGTRYDYAQYGYLYGSRDDVAVVGGNGRDLFRMDPDTYVGRLVETPEEIGAQLRAYRTSSTRTIGNSFSLVAGYDFLADASTKVAARLDQIGLGADQSLISETWTAANLLGKWGDAHREAVSVVNGHFDHTALLSGSGNSGTSDTLTTAQFVSGVGTILAGSMVVTIGCHSGLPVPDYAVTDPSQALDWPQAMSRAGVATYVGSLGYGYGDTELTAYSERLEELFVQQLGRQETVGEALNMAKRLYLMELPTVTAYDAKVLSSFTLFGIPTWKTPGSHPKPVFTDLPTRQSAGPDSGTTAPVTAAGLAAGVDQLPFTLVPQFETDAAMPSGIKVRSTDRGSYVVGSDGDLSATPREAALPSASMALPNRPGLEPAGVLFDTVVGTVLPGVSSPLVSNPSLVHDGTVAAGSSETSPRTAATIARSLTSSRLNAVTGRFRPSGTGATGDYSVLTNLSGKVFYRTPVANEPADVVTRIEHSTTRNGANAPVVTVTADDTNGVWLVRVIYRTATGQWSSATLMPGGTTSTTSTLTGTAAAPAGPVDGFVQVVDRNGRVVSQNL